MRVSLLFSLVVLIGVTPAFATITTKTATDRIAKLPNKQALKIGLAGFGQCKIVADWVMGIKTYNVKTAPHANGVIGNGAVIVNVGSTQIAHGIAYHPSFATLLADVNRVFPAAAYAQFRTMSPEDNAALMFKNAVVNNKCGSISSTSLNQVIPFEMKNFDPKAMKDKFKFYMGANGDLACTTSVVSKPLFNSLTCQNEFKDVPLPEGLCNKFYNQFALMKRLDVKPGTQVLPPVALNELTPALAAEFAVLRLDDAVLASAEGALTKPRLYVNIDPTHMMVDTANLSDPTEALNAAKLAKFYDTLSASQKSDLTIEPAYAGIITTVKANASVQAQYATALLYVNSPSHAMLAPSAIQAVMAAEIEPIKNILPAKFSVKNINCAAMMAAPAQQAINMQ